MSGMLGHYAYSMHPIMPPQMAMGSMGPMGMGSMGMGSMGMASSVMASPSGQTPVVHVYTKRRLTEGVDADEGEAVCKCAAVHGAQLCATYTFNGKGKGNGSVSVDVTPRVEMGHADTLWWQWKRTNDTRHSDSHAFAFMNRSASLSVRALSDGDVVVSMVMTMADDEQTSSQWRLHQRSDWHEMYDGAHSTKMCAMASELRLCVEVDSDAYAIANVTQMVASIQFL